MKFSKINFYKNLNLNLGSEGCVLKTSSFERLFCRCYAARLNLLLFIRRRVGCSSDLLCRFSCVGWITEDDEALLPALVLRPSPSSCCLLLTPPLPTPHSKFSLCSFTIRSVRSRPACRAQDSMEGTITHSLSNSDAKSVPAVGGRRLHFKMLQRQKKILTVIQTELHFYYFCYTDVHANAFCTFKGKLNLYDFSIELSAAQCGLKPKTVSPRYTHVNAIRPSCLSSLMNTLRTRRH